MKLEQTIKKFIKLGYTEPEIQSAMNQAKINKSDKINIKSKVIKKIMQK